MRRGRIPWIALAAWLAAAPAWAEAEAFEADGESEEEGWVPLGEATRAWLDRQRRGIDESPNPHGLTAPEEHRARSRYLESLNHPIPPLFDLDEQAGELD